MTDSRISARPRPTWESLLLRCTCGHAWQDWQPQNVPIETWIAHMSVLFCPACLAGGGSPHGKVLLAETQEPAP